MIARRRWLLAAAGLAAAHLARAQGQGARLPRVGVLRSTSAGDAQSQAFLQGLRELGYAEGRNITIEYPPATLEQLPATAAELVRHQCDVIFAPTPQAAQAARAASSSIPIVFAVVGDVVSTGLAKSLSAPGLNATGLTALGSSLSGKRVELLKEVLPRLSRIGVLWNPTVVDKMVEFKETQPFAARMGISLQSAEVKAPGDFDAAFERIRRSRVEAMITLGEPLTFSQIKRIVEFQNQNRIAGIFNWRQAVEAGGLLAYGPDIADLYRRAAVYVDKILRGSAPGSLPIEEASKFEMAVNTRTAKALGINVPRSVLVRADTVL